MCKESFESFFFNYFFCFFNNTPTSDRRVRDALPKLRTWAERFLQPQRPQQTASFDDNPRTPIKINKVLDIEQSIWCPMWGVTGKIDMVVQVKLVTLRGLRV